jgi:hypothetical protein
MRRERRERTERRQEDRKDKNLYPPSCPHSGKLSFLPCSTIKTPVPLRLMAEDSPFILFKSSLFSPRMKDSLLNDCVH